MRTPKEEPAEEPQQAGPSAAKCAPEAVQIICSCKAAHVAGGCHYWCVQCQSWGVPRVCHSCIMSWTHWLLREGFQHAGVRLRPDRACAARLPVHAALAAQMSRGAGLAVSAATTPERASAACVPVHACAGVSNMWRAALCIPQSGRGGQACHPSHAFPRQVRKKLSARQPIQGRTGVHGRGCPGC